MKYIQIPVLTLLFLASPASHSNDEPEKQPPEYFLDQSATSSEGYVNFELGILESLLLAEIAVDREDFGTALQHYLAAADQTQDPEIAHRATDLAVLYSSLSVALEPALIWADASPEDEQAQATAAAVLIALSKVEQSVPYLYRLQEHDPEHVASHFQLLYDELQHSDDRAQLIRALEMVKKQYPDQSGAYIALSNIYLLERQPETAFSISQQAVDKGFSDPSLFILHTEALRSLRQGNKALEFLKQHIDKYADEPELRLYYADLLLNIYNAPEKAKSQVIALRDYDELNGDQLLNIVYLTLEAQWMEEATFFLQQLRADPNNEDTAEYFLGSIAEIRGDKSTAIELYKEVEAGEYHASSYLQAAMLLSADNNLDDALETIQLASPSTLGDVKHISLIELEVLSKMESFEEAFDVLSDALAYLPRDTDLLYIRGLLAEKLGDLPTAEADLRAILEVSPTHLEAINALGYMLTNRTSRHAEALVLIQRAYTMAPSNAGVLDSMGWVQFRLGNLDKAREYLEVAYKTSPEGLIAAHLGEVLWVQGHKAEASTLWNDTLANYPNDEFLHETLKRLMPEYATAKNDLTQ